MFDIFEGTEQPWNDPVPEVKGKMFDFKKEEELLLEHFVSDIRNIIMSYIDTPLDSFKDININKCMEDGDYLYYTKEKTLTHYLFDQEGIDYVVDMLNNSEYLNANNFQNQYDWFKRTELWFLCRANEGCIIREMDGLTSKHFQNKDCWYHTELYWVCQNKMYYLLLQICYLNGPYCWKPEHFLNFDEHNKSELSYLIVKELEHIMLKIKGWKCEHFLSKNTRGYSKLAHLCYAKMSKFLLSIKWKPEHFLNIDEDGETELYILCNNKMYDVIRHVEFKEEHCGSDMEKKYLEMNFIFYS